MSVKFPVLHIFLALFLLISRNYRVCLSVC